AGSCGGDFCRWTWSLSLFPGAWVAESIDDDIGRRKGRQGRSRKSSGSWQQRVYAPQPGQGQDSTACCSYTEKVFATVHVWPQLTHAIVRRITRHLSVG